MSGIDEKEKPTTLFGALRARLGLSRKNDAPEKRPDEGNAGAEAFEDDDDGDGVSKPPISTSDNLPLATLKVYIATVAIPLLLYIIYILAIRSPGYLSQAEVVVQLDPVAGGTSVDFGFLAGPSGGLIDALLIKTYIESYALMDELDRDLKIREHYADPTKDVLSRLWGWSSHERFYDFYGTRVEVFVDGDSQVIHLDVEAYDREYAQRMAQTIVQSASRFVNGISQTMARDQVAFVQRELDRSQERLRQTTADLVALRQKNDLLSPETETQTLSGIIASLQSDLAGRRAALTTLRAYLNESAPEVAAARDGITGLERQIALERAKQTGSNGGPGSVGKSGDKALGDLVLEYQAAQTAVAVANSSYLSGLTTLEAARLAASRTAKHLIEVSPPNLPDESLRPRRLYSIVTAFFLLNIIFFILTLVAASIRDHRDA